MKDLFKGLIYLFYFKDLIYLKHVSKDLFTVTKDLQQDTKSFIDQMSKQLISITNIVKGNQQMREPMYLQTMYPQIPLVTAC